MGWRGWAEASSVGDMAAIPDDRDEVRLRAFALLRCVSLKYQNIDV